MSQTNRPAVKRQYGSRKPGAASTSSRGSVFASSSSPPRSSILSSMVNSEWEAALRDGPSSSSSSSQGKGKERCRGSTPPTSSPPTSTSDAPLASASQSKRARETCSVSEQDAGRGGEDLRSFFNRTSPPRAARTKRRRSPQDEDDDERKLFTPGNSASPRSSSRKPPSFRKSASTSTSTLSQLYLDPFTTPGHSTVHCPTCSLSYSRTPEDVNFHAKHHKKIVSGIEWSDSLTTSSSTATTTTTGVTLCREGVEWKGGREEGKVLMVDWSTADSSTKRRLNDVMSTIDTELSSTSLTEQQLSESKLFLFVTTKTRKVVACAVVQRIHQAYRVVVKDTHGRDGTHAEEGKKDAFGEQGLIRFDDQDSSAIFCSPTPLPTLLGVHRIWTSTSHRRNGFASLLLDAMAERFVYACPIAHGDRERDVAFSQPTGKGHELAKRWTGTTAFKVFVD